jgi:flagellar basal-body rod modification protein FlgD
MNISPASSAMPATVVSLPTTDQLPASSASANTSGGLGSESLNENDFLQLLTAQLENQDPLNPMSASDFAAQLAQFSTAIGVEQLQTTQASYGNLQLSSLVGQNVAVNGNSLVLAAGGTAKGAVGLSGAASDVIVTVMDSSGNVVQTLDLGAQPAGTQSFTWNGQTTDGDTAAAGTYAFSVQAVSANSGTNVTATPYAVVPVTGVSLGGSNGPLIDLGGGLAPVGLSGILQVF